MLVEVLEMQMAEEPSEVWEVLELSHLEQVLF
jgi:hypothetical protein